MPSNLRLPVILAVLGLVAFLWLAFIRPHPEIAAKGTAEGPGGKPVPGAAPLPPTLDPDGNPIPGIVDTTNTDPRFTRFTDGTVHWLPSFAASRRLHKDTEPRADLDILDQLLADYRLVYQENPVGTENAEIVAQLLGRNPKKIYFLDPGLSALDEQGRLLDRWGSPFRFHPLKADLMDVLSLGPDRKPWTEDDLSLDVQAEEEELKLRPEN